MIIGLPSDDPEVIAAAYLPVGVDFVPPPEVAPGVLAVVREVRGFLLIPFVEAISEGNGDVGRWLDTLPLDRTVVFSTVVSDRLQGMLERRGFWPGRMRFGAETADVWLRRVRA